MFLFSLSIMEFIFHNSWCVNQIWIKKPPLNSLFSVISKWAVNDFLFLAAMTPLNLFSCVISALAPFFWSPSAKKRVVVWAPSSISWLLQSPRVVYVHQLQHQQPHHPVLVWCPLMISNCLWPWSVNLLVNIACCAPGGTTPAPSFVSMPMSWASSVSILNYLSFKSVLTSFKGSHHLLLFWFCPNFNNYLSSLAL